ncbi:PDCD5-related protein [Leucosporidium creatinivorum]|uniref:PDCD5-related protein n=1 Tax=Leucosporidium creatinivorum TaxID=106004 RepID=A0A1Y2ENZ5_9BASI|nr:PDCD5-related protein [Leucosporidium creatinivorum]
MDSSDLDAIRAKRMAELQSQQGSSSSAGGGRGGSPSGPPGGMGGGGAEDAAKQAQQEEQRRTIMSQILSPEARERLNRIALVRPERARGVEDLLARMAQGGQLRGRVSEDQLIGVLDQIEAGEKKQRGGGQAEASGGKIIFNRRKDFDDSDDDF